MFSGGVEVSSGGLEIFFVGLRNFRRLRNFRGIEKFSGRLKFFWVGGGLIFFHEGLGFSGGDEI